MALAQSGGLSALGNSGSSGSSSGVPTQLTATPVVDPWTSPGSFRTLYLGGMAAPGIIPAKGGISGFAIKRKIDKKEAKGKDGATTTDTGEVPIEGAIKLHIYTQAQFQAYYAFLDMAAAARAASKALDVVHPTINAAGVSAVLIEELGALLHEQNFLWSYELKLVKWLAKPPDGGGTPKGAQSGSSSTDPNSQIPPDPNGALRRQVIDAQNQAENLPDND